MQVLIVNQSEVARLLPMEACMEAMGEALRSLSRGESMLPLAAMLRREFEVIVPDMPGFGEADEVSPDRVTAKAQAEFLGNLLVGLRAVKVGVQVHQRLTVVGCFGKTDGLLDHFVEELDPFALSKVWCGPLSSRYGGCNGIWIWRGRPTPFCYPLAAAMRF